MNGFQLEMQFSSGSNRLRECLENGLFSVWIEHSPPPAGQNHDYMRRTAEALEQAAASVTLLPAGLAITDNSGDPAGAVRSIEYASMLDANTRNRHIVYISGCNTTQNEAAELLGMAANAGISNIVPVTGNAAAGSTVKKPGIYTESTKMLAGLNGADEFFAGTTVNPFKYSPLPLVGQYAKLMRKINSGAQFVVTQAGFDMAKLHEVQHYLAMRQCYVPMVARLILLTPEVMADILAGKHPGVVISQESQAQLRRELCFSSQQFQAAQWRRLELQAAGCRFLGFSGIQLVGADTPDRLKIACTRIANALNEFSSFPDWLAEYEAWVGRADLSNHTNGFYFFNNLLSSNDDDIAVPKPVDFDFPAPSGGERLLLAIRQSLFPADAAYSGGERTFLKMLFAGCKGCSDCNLAKTFYVCSRHCPKKLSDGPCGGADGNGSCEFGSRACIFNQITRLAGISGGVDSLETPENGGIKNG